MADVCALHTGHRAGRWRAGIKHRSTILLGRPSGCQTGSIALRRASVGRGQGLLALRRGGNVIAGRTGVGWRKSPSAWLLLLLRGRRLLVLWRWTVAHLLLLLRRWLSILWLLLVLRWIGLSLRPLLLLLLLLLRVSLWRPLTMPRSLPSLRHGQRPLPLPAPGRAPDAHIPHLALHLRPLHTIRHLPDRRFRIAAPPLVPPSIRLGEAHLLLPRRARDWLWQPMG